MQNRKLTTNNDRIEQAARRFVAAARGQSAKISDETVERVVRQQVQLARKQLDVR